jgi:hypothetical protein
MTSRNSNLLTVSVVAVVATGLLWNQYKKKKQAKDDSKAIDAWCAVYSTIQCRTRSSAFFELGCHETRRISTRPFAYFELGCHELRRTHHRPSSHVRRTPWAFFSFSSFLVIQKDFARTIKIEKKARGRGAESVVFYLL